MRRLPKKSSIHELYFALRRKEEEPWWRCAAAPRNLHNTSNIELQKVFVVKAHASFEFEVS